MSPSNPNVNQTVTFQHGQVAELLRRLERFLGIPLSLRSNTGEVVVKTDYFFGPCSIIRGTEVGRLRCQKTYRNIEDHLLYRKVPYVNICYAGFLIFAVPLEFQGEMIGTLFGAQILPIRLAKKPEILEQFRDPAQAVGIRDMEEFCRSFERVRNLEPDFQRISFLEFLQKIGENFISMALAGKSWPQFYREIKGELKILERSRFQLPT